MRKQTKGLAKLYAGSAMVIPEKGPETKSVDASAPEVRAGYSPMTARV